MSWHETRGAATATARRAAHSDDAKHRPDETVRASARRVPRGARLVPVVVAGALVLLVAGGATALIARGGDDPKPSGAPSAKSPTPAAPAVDAKTGLPLRPTTEDVSYAVTERCLSKSKAVSGVCENNFPFTLECPDGTCTIGLTGGPAYGDDSFEGRDGVAFRFQAGQPSFAFAGTKRERGWPCPEKVTVNGTRRADGGYDVRFMQRHSAFSEGCLYDPGTYAATLTAPES